MLKQRIITAIVLLIIVIGVIYFTPPHVFQIAAALVLLAAAWEWGSLLGPRYGSTAVKILLVVLTALVYFNVLVSSSHQWVLWVAAATVVWGLLAIIAYNHKYTPAGFQYALLKALACILLLVPTLYALVTLRISSHGSALVFYALTLVFVNDIAAYFGGRFFGKHKLASLVSPKKTWEGFACGMAAGIVWSIAVTAIFWSDSYSILSMVIVAIPTLIAAVIGDLFISVLKRLVELKDTGSLLPGHGGLLDRIDAVIMAIPVFTLVASYCLL